MNRSDFLKWLVFAPFTLKSMDLQNLYQFSSGLPKTPKMPALFVGHGSPMNAIEENIFVENWRKVARNIPTPSAILCISAHWETRGTKVTAMPKPQTIHDFGGFPKELFTQQYPAPGFPELATDIQQLFTKTHIELDHQWGLDHGTWSVLIKMYPEANIPVLQLSMDITQSTSYHYGLAKTLSVLRERGVLIIGSGNMVHNLRILNWNSPNSGYDWAIEANEQFKNMIVENNLSQLFQIRNTSEAFRLAVPSYDHYHPMMYVMGIQDKKDEVSFFNDQLMMGSLSMTSFVLS